MQNKEKSLRILERGYQSSKKNVNPTIFGLEIKYLVLVLLVFQNSASALMQRYSRSILKERYSISVVVVCVEMIKCTISLIMMFRDSSSFSTFRFRVITMVQTSSLLFVPAFIYYIQKCLSFEALQRIEPQLYSVLVQLKLLTTALFSVVMLRKSYSFRKWRALVLLLLSLVLMKYAKTSDCAVVDATNTTTLSHDEQDVFGANTNQYIGTCFAIAVAFSSGFSGVYFERILKGSARVSIWERNFQLCLYGVPLAILGVFMFDGEIVKAGIFTGFSPVTWVVACLFSCGGLLVAMIAKYADMVIKGFATGLAIVTTCFMSFLLFDAEITPIFCLAAGGVLISLLNYNEQDAKQ